MPCWVVRFFLQLTGSLRASAVYFWAVAKHSSGDKPSTKGGRAFVAQKSKEGTSAVVNLAFAKLSFPGPTLTLAENGGVVLKEAMPFNLGDRQ